ncbi:MAG: DUF4116 domain-containing protein [bacterium]
MLNLNFFLYKFASEQLRNDEEFTLIAIKLNGYNMAYASNNLK